MNLQKNKTYVLLLELDKNVKYLYYYTTHLIRLQVLSFLEAQSGWTIFICINPPGRFEVPPKTLCFPLSGFLINIDVELVQGARYCVEANLARPSILVEVQVVAALQ